MLTPLIITEHLSESMVTPLTTCTFHNIIPTMSKRALPPPVSSLTPSKKARPNARGNLLDLQTVQCKQMSTEFLTFAGLPTSVHKSFLSTSNMINQAGQHVETINRVYPDHLKNAIDIRESPTGLNIVQKERLAYYLCVQNAYAYEELLPTMKEPLITAVPTDRKNRNVLTIINDHLADNLFLLLHSFASNEVIQTIRDSKYELWAPCPFCNRKFSHNRDAWTDIMSFPNNKSDFLSPTTIDENSIFKLMNNYVLQSHCQNAPSLKNKTDSNKAKVFHAAHKYFANLTELIRNSFETDLIQLIESPIDDKERRYLAGEHDSPSDNSESPTS